MGKGAKRDTGLGAVMLTVAGYRCRCGHEWVAKGEERPRVCPKCKSARWDQPKLWERAK